MLNKKSPLALMHLDAFLLENQRRTLIWLIGIYFANTLMAFILTWANQSLVEPSIYVVTQVTRATIMGLQGFAFISVYRSQVRWVQAAILSAISLGLSLAIFLPSMYAEIATIAFTITLVTTIFVMSILFQNTKLNLLTIATSIIAFNLFSLSLAINPLVIVRITPELIVPMSITMNFLLLLVSLFVITNGVGLNRLRYYISNLVYIDLKTRLYNERQLDFEISSFIKKGEEFILLAIDFKNLLALNRQHGYRAVHPVFLHQIELIKRAMMPYGMPFKLEGPIFAFILKLDHHMLAQVEQSINQLTQQLRAKGLEGNSSSSMEHQWLATQYPTDGETAQQLIDNLYHLKYVIDSKVSPIRW